MKIWATQNAADTTGTGTTDFTHGTVTETPIAALHCFTNGTTSGTDINQALMSVGFTDGTSEFFASFGCQHNVATSNTVYRRGNTACISSCFTSGSTEDGAMSHNSFISGGQRLNNDNAFGNARLVNSLFFNATNATATSATLNATVDTAVNVDPGHAWDFVIFIGCAETVAAGDTARLYMGFFDGTNQGCIAFNSDDGNASPGVVALQISDTYCGAHIDIGTGALDYGIDAQVGSGTSIDLYPRNNGGNTDPVYCLFIGSDTNESVSVVSWDSPTSTGSNAVTGVGFKPQAVISLFSFAAAYDTAEADGDAGAFAIGFETTDDQFCAGICDEDATGGNSDTESITSSQSIYVNDDAGTSGVFNATLTSHDSDGWTHSFSATDGTARKWISLAIQEEQTAAATGGAVLHHRRMLGMT